MATWDRWLWYEDAASEFPVFLGHVQKQSLLPGMSGGGGVGAEGTTPEAGEKVPEGAQA